MYSVYKVQYPICVLYVLHNGCSRAPSADSVSMYSVQQPLVIASARIFHSVAPYSPSRILKRHLSHGYILPWPVADLKIVTWGFLLRLQLHSKEYGSVGEGSWIKRLTDRSIQTQLVLVLCILLDVRSRVLRECTMYIRHDDTDRYLWWHDPIQYFLWSWWSRGFHSTSVRFPVEDWLTDRAAWAAMT